MKEFLGPPTSASHRLRVPWKPFSPATGPRLSRPSLSESSWGLTVWGPLQNFEVSGLCARVRDEGSRSSQDGPCHVARIPDPRETLKPKRLGFDISGFSCGPKFLNPESSKAKASFCCFWGLPSSANQTKSRTHSTSMVILYIDTLILAAPRIITTLIEPFLRAPQPKQCWPGQD